MPRALFLLLPAVLAILAALPGCAAHGPLSNAAEPGDLMLPNGSAVADAALTRRAMAEDYILVGEVHDNPLHHQVQARLIRALAPMRPAVGLEMVAVDKKTVLERFGKGEISIDALSEALGWEANWGYDFALYRPIFAALAEEKIPVRGLNVPREVLEALREKGTEGLSPAARAALPDPVIFPAQARREELAKIFKMHEAMRRKPEPGNPRPTVERFILVQSIWDTGMAEQAVRLRREHGRPVIVLAGDGHVRGGTGIAERIVQLDPGARILLISPAPSQNTADLEGADFYYLSPPRNGRLGLSLEEESGVVRVRAVMPDSPAVAAGVRPGDRLVSVAGRPVHSLEDAHAGAMAREPGKPLILEVQRDGKSLRLEAAVK